MIKYSVIVPYYNTQSYVKNIINWYDRIAETRNDIELILVDDGSTINLNAFEFLHDGIQVYSKINGGVSSARNYGISKAIGEFILFLDSDDVYHDEIFTILDDFIVSVDSKLDVVVFSYEKVFDNKVIKVINPNGKYLNSELLASFFCKKIKPHICSILFRRTMILDNFLLFTEGVSHSEDLSFIARSFSVSKNSFSISDVLFKYNFRGGSAINSPVCIKSLSHFKSFDEILRVETDEHMSSSKEFYVSLCYINIVKFVLIFGVESLHIWDFIYSKREYINFNVFSNPKLILNKLTYIVFFVDFLFLLPFNFMYRIVRFKLKRRQVE